MLVVEFYRFSEWYPCSITYITCNFNFSRPSVITTNANQNESYLLRHSLVFLLWISKLTGEIFCRFYDSCCMIFGSWLLWRLCYFHPSKSFHHWSIHKNLPRNISLHTYQNIETDIRKEYENTANRFKNTIWSKQIHYCLHNKAKSWKSTLKIPFCTRFCNNLWDARKIFVWINIFINEVHLLHLFCVTRKGNLFSRDKNL